MYLAKTHYLLLKFCLGSSILLPFSY
jgi:hypothetical protein